MDADTEIINLIRVVNTLAGSQKTWNQEHDKRSKEVLERIEGKLKELQTQVGVLPCEKRKTEITSLIEIFQTKIKSVEKRMSWLWVGFSSAFGIAIFATFFKVFFA